MMNDRSLLRGSVAQQGGQQEKNRRRAQPVEQPPVTMEFGSDDVDVSAQIVGSETPRTGPKQCPRGVVRSESPPGHAHHSSDDSIELPQAVDKSRQENDYATAPLKNIFEALLSHRVDLELVEHGATAPATDRVTDAIPDRRRGGYEEQKPGNIYPSLSGLQRARHQQGLPGSGNSHSLRHHRCGHCAVTITLQQRLRARKIALESPSRPVHVTIRRSRNLSSGSTR